MAAVLIATSGSHALTQLEQIQARGVLLMLTVNGATTYHLGPEGETGFEYDLARQFADYLELPLEVTAYDNISDLVPALVAGQGDFIAANFSRIPERLTEARFGPSYEEAKPVVVYRRGSRRPQRLEQLREGRTVILAGTSYEPLLISSLAAEESPWWELEHAASIEDVFEAISQEDVDYTIIDSNILALNRRFFPSIRPAFELDQAHELAWAVRAGDDDSLVDTMRRFFAWAEEHGAMARLRERHYDHVEGYEPVGTYTFMRQMRERLPPLRPLFEKAAEANDLEWKLLAAVGYQESHWNPDAISRTGVRGVMMLTRRTASQLGVEDRRDPAQSIDGGARYLRSLMDRLPERIPEPDRTWLALAAYNIGFGHLEDARVLTQRLGGNPDRWVDVREHLPLLTQEQWYRQTRFGYARGHEPVQFVENIRTFHEILIWMDGRDHPLLAIEVI